MLNDTQKGVIYQLVPTYWKDGEMFLKCRLKHVKCDFHGTVFPKINPYKSKLSGGLKISEITAIFGNRYNSELYNVSNYRGFEVSEHAKLCYNYLYGELVSEMIKTGSANHNILPIIISSTVYVFFKALKNILLRFLVQKLRWIKLNFSTIFVKFVKMIIVILKTVMFLVKT